VLSVEGIKMIKSVASASNAGAIFEFAGQVNRAKVKK
jgi:hypothetical protein